MMTIIIGLSITKVRMITIMMMMMMMMMITMVDL